MINKVILLGRLGGDPEVRYTPDGMMVTNFNMATSESRKDKKGEKIQKTEWHKIITFGKLAEICSQYLTKGKLVFIEGRIQYRAWEDKDGNKRSSTEIVANTMQMLDTKPATQGTAQGKDMTQGKQQNNNSTDAEGTQEFYPDEDVPF